MSYRLSEKEIRDMLEQTSKRMDNINEYREDASIAVFTGIIALLMLDERVAKYDALEVNKQSSGKNDLG